MRKLINELELYDTVMKMIKFNKIDIKNLKAPNGFEQDIKKESERYIFPNIGRYINAYKTNEGTRRTTRQNH